MRPDTIVTPVRWSWFAQREHPTQPGFLQMLGFVSEKDAQAQVEFWRDRPDLRPYYWERPDQVTARIQDRGLTRLQVIAFLACLAKGDVPTNTPTEARELLAKLGYTLGPVMGKLDASTLEFTLRDLTVEDVMALAAKVPIR
jgi:hypothetical protein